MAEIEQPRRRRLATSGIAGVGLLLATRGAGLAAPTEKATKRGSKEKKVGAVEPPSKS